MCSVAVERPRVLLVPDSLYWATGGIARAIAAHNPGFRFETLSEPVLTGLLDRFPDTPEYFDAVHFLVPHSADRLAPLFATRTAIVNTLHHIESQRCTTSLASSDAIMVGTTQWQKELLDLGLPEEQIVRVPYGVDVATFEPASAEERRRVRRELGLPFDAFVVGYCAQRSERKGVDVLLSGLSLLAQRLPGAACLLMGPGWGSLARERNAEGLPCVHFPYAVDTEHLARVYRALDVLWVTSRIEGGPLPALEAMATAVPCISTPVGIPLDLVNDGENGFLVPFDDAEALCRRTLRLANDTRLHSTMAAAARRTVTRGCQWSQTMPRATALYERALQRFRLRGGRSETAREARPPRSELPRAWRQWTAGREHHLFSKSLLKRREYKSAEELALRALRANPRDPLLWLHAGGTKLELALRVLRVNPRDLKLWLHLQRGRLRPGTRPLRSTRQ